jgi:hypothetical protein
MRGREKEVKTRSSDSFYFSREPRFVTYICDGSYLSNQSEVPLWAAAQ